MSTDLLYRKDMLRLAADARGAGHLPLLDATGSASNPVCGDRVTVELALANGRVTALAHQTQACVLTQASAALLAGVAPGKNRVALAALLNDVKSMLAGGPAVAGYEVFAGVADHAGRHVCVLLPFRAALDAFEAAEEGALGSQDKR